MTVAVAALCACAVAACGRAAPRTTQPLAPAGTARDDGRGVLARLSSGSALPPRSDAARARAAAKETADGEEGDESGADAAGAGGVRYGNYHFDRAPRPHSAPLPYARRYVPFAPVEYGTIEGAVQWPHPPRAPERLVATGSGPPDQAAACAGALNQTLALSSGSGVANAVVYLEDVATGRMLLGRVNSSFPNPTKHLQIGGILEWRACRFHPHVQVVAPIGSVLSLSTADEPVAVTATRVEGRARESLWAVPLGARGASHEHLLDRDGFLELRAEAAGHAASGWVVVASNPYYALTDEHGRFVIAQVPPGSYTLVVWHEPVVVGFTRAGEPVTHTPPPVKRRIVVRAREEQRVIVKLHADSAR
jgi:hypothetical protein